MRCRTFISIIATLIVMGAPGEARLLQAAAEPVDPDAQLLQEAHIGTDAKSLQEYLRARSPVDVDPQRLNDLIRQLGSPRFQDREQASKKLITLGPAVLPLLRQAEKSSDQEVVRRAKQCTEEIGRGSNGALSSGVVRLLVQRYPEIATQALLGFLPYAEFDTQLEEQVWYELDRLAARETKSLPALARSLHDAFAVRRGLAACILGHRGNPEQRAAVRALLADADALVRLRAVQGLLAGKDKAAVPVLVALLDQPSVAVAWQAEELLHWIAGEDSPEQVVGAGTPEDRQRCRKAWEAWRRAFGTKLDLKKLDQEYRRPGLVLVSEKQSVGQVEEWYLLLYGCDSKPRWRLKDGWGAKLLPGDRVLVPYLPGSSAVVERDLQGKIVWRYDWTAPVSACWRLPNGNTFIANDEMRFAEVTPEGKQVYFRDFSARGSDLQRVRAQAPQRLPNGHLFCSGEDHNDPALSEKQLLIEFDPDSGRILKRVPLPVKKHARVATIEALPGGHYQLVDLEHPRVLEIDVTGKVVWQHAQDGLGSATRLPGGNTLITCGFPVAGRIAEIDRGGKMVAEVLFSGGAWSVQSCLSLVRLGFERFASGACDLATSVPYRIKGLRSKDAFVRATSVWALSDLGPKAAAAVPALIEALNDPDQLVRHRAWGALAHVGPAALPKLLQATKDKRPNVRSGAIGLLEKYPGEARRLGPVLIAALQDQNVRVRRSAAWALKELSPKLEDKEVIPALVKALKDDDRNPDPKVWTVRWAAASALGKLGPRAKEAVPELLRALKVEDVKDAKEAAPIRCAVIWALGEIGPDAKAAVPSLKEALHDQDEFVRAGAVKALKKIEGKK